MPEPVFENRRNEFVVTLYNQEHSMNKKDEKADLIAFCQTPKSRQEIGEFLGLKTIAFITEEYIQPLVDSGKLTIPNKPRNRNQKYYS